jgi:hypothetical protein
MGKKLRANFYTLTRQVDAVHAGAANDDGLLGPEGSIHHVANGRLQAGLPSRPSTDIEYISATRASFGAVEYFRQ